MVRLKLSIGMIFDEIADAEKDINIKTCFNGYDRLLNLERYKLYEKDTIFRSDTLYIVLDETFLNHRLSFLTIEDGTAIICSGDININKLPSKASYILFPNMQKQLMFLINQITNIFFKYNQIEAAFNNILVENKCTGVQQLVDIATPLFGNEITVRTAEFRYVGTSFHHIRHLETAAIPQPNNNVYSKDAIDSLKSDINYKDQNPTNNAWFYKNDFYDCSFWCYDIYLHNRFLYRLKIADILQPFRAYDPELLLYFAEYLRKAQNEGTLYLTEYMTTLIDGIQATTQNRVSEELMKLGWKNSDSYQLFYIKSGDQSREITNLSYYCSYLNKELKSVFSFKYNDGIILIANLTTGFNHNSQDFVQDLLVFLREGNFRAGISNVFTPFEEPKSYYLQAKTALALGLRYHPSIWSYYFQQYRFHYIKSLIQSDFPEIKLIAPELDRLKRNDENKHTEYYSTLKIFLNNNQSLSQTASILNIHRSTLIYRLEKIKKALNISVWTSKDVLFLQLCMELIDLEI